LPPRQKDKGYVRPPLTDQTFVPDRFGTIEERKEKQGGQEKG
jgi:hypothetical protein